jgi:hypothetical protein
MWIQGPSSGSAALSTGQASPRKAGMIRGRCKIGSATARSSTPCAIPNCRRRASKIRIAPAPPWPFQVC